MKKIFTLVFCIFCTLFVCGQVELIDLKGYYNGDFRYEKLDALHWRPETQQYSFYDKNEKSIVSIDVKNNKKECILNFEQFYKDIKSDEITYKNNGGKLSPSYQWINSHELSFGCNIPNKGPQKVIYNTQNHNFSYQPLPTSDGTIVEISEDQSWGIVNFENDHNYYVTDWHQNYILCPDTGENIVFGEPVHRSEWGIEEGWYFSPQSNFIAFYRMDESMVEDYPLLQTSKEDGAAAIAYIQNIKYPMAGRTNHQVKVGIFDVRQSFLKHTTIYHYIQTDINDGEFLTNVTFSPDEKYLYITHLNRAQNHSKLIRYDIATGQKIGTLIEETDEKYVEPKTRMTFLKNGNFLWQSEKDGWNHFYLYSFDGKQLQQITKGDWDVIENLGIDDTEQYLYFITNKDYPTDRFLYKVSLKNGTLTNLTPQLGTHSITLSNDKKYFFDVFTNLHTPKQIFACSTDGKIHRMILESKNPYEKYELGNDTIFALQNNHGDYLYCEMILPPHFDAKKKYPCLVYVYGGPHSQLVTNRFMNGGIFLNYMAQKGYVIFILDNRGTDNRGTAFEKCIHRQLGVLESEDQMVGIQYLHSLPFIDKDRIGIDGWSFGGFMTLTMITEHPDIFHSATCGGPVVNWEWYEIMYGERYMDTPKENPEGYAHANIIPKINKLRCPLLIMHGQQDHTVMQQNSLELLHQSVLDDVQIQYFPYTTHDHNVRNKDRVQMWHKIEQFHDQYLMKQ